MSPIFLMTASAGCVLLSFFFLSMLFSAHLLMQRHAKLLSYAKSVNPANNKLLQMSQVQRSGEVTENFSGKNKIKKIAARVSSQIDPKAFNCLGRRDCGPFDLANHLPGAAVVVGCVDENMLAGVAA